MEYIQTILAYLFGVSIAVFLMNLVETRKVDGRLFLREIVFSALLPITIWMILIDWLLDLIRR